MHDHGPGGHRGGSETFSAPQAAHRFASLLLSQGVAIPKVSAFLGYRDSVITLKVYAHFIQNKKNDVQELASAINTENEVSDRLKPQTLRPTIRIAALYPILILELQRL